MRGLLENIEFLKIKIRSKMTDYSRLIHLSDYIVLNFSKQYFILITAKTECVTNGCSQLCAVNSSGIEYCSCYSGYELNPDGKTCDSKNKNYICLSFFESSTFYT